MEKGVAKEEFNLKFGEVTRIGGQGAVKSVNGQVGDVILTTSDIENTSGYQDEDEVAAAINRATDTLQGEIDDLSADKQDKLTAGENITIEGNVISATGGGSSVNIVQSTGNSTTDVMSQKATTDMVYGDGDAKTNVRLGSGATAYNTGSISVGQKASSGSSGVAIGSNTTAYNAGVAIGQGADTSTRDNVVIVGKQAFTLLKASDNSVYLGSNVRSANTYPYSVALGNGATITRRGEVNISTGDDNTNGYNNTSYRILGGVHDPVEAQDAATKNYVDAAVAGAGGETVNVVQSTGDSTEDVMSQKAVTDALNSVGGGSAIELTETDFNYPANNPTAVALWLLPPGVYYTTTLTISTNASTSQVLASTSTQLLNQQNMTTFLTLEGYRGVKTIIGANGNMGSSLFKSGQVFSFLNVDNTGNYQGGSVLLQKTNVKDSLTSTSTDTPLSANQGKILNDKITALEARLAALEGN